MSESPRSTILVVDDERGPRESLRLILEPVYRVLQAASGSDALEVLRCEPVDLVTVDLNMPGMRGEELVRTLRAEYPRVGVIVITGCGTLESAVEAVRLGISDYLQKPFDVVHVAAAVGRALTQKHSLTRLVDFLEQLGSLVGCDRESEAVVGDVERSQKMRSQIETLFRTSAPSGPLGTGPRTEEFLVVLAETLESKDSFIHGHARRVASYSSLLAERLQLSNRERHDLRLAAFLHDLGKVGIPTGLLDHEGPLSAAELELVQQHPALGERLLRPLEIAPGVMAAVRHHHEWWDGTGYPDGLAGDDIPLAARIIAIADTYDAMISDRPYRTALPPEAAAEELRRFAGTQFDTDLVFEFLAVLDSCVTTGVEPDFFANVMMGPHRAPAANEATRA
ncbi:MAG: response regulator [Myxococcota bacterium]|nr:response regulator [Myxococcota bacterium]